MADNILLPSHGTSMATDDVAGVHFHKFKLATGAAGVDGGVVSDVNPLPTSLSGTAGDYAPQYGATPPGSVPAQVDPAGQMMTRGLVLTDEGGYRLNCANTSLSVSIGDCTFTNGSDVVTGTGFEAVDLHYGNYVYLDADGITAMVQVAWFNDTEIGLATPYSGAGGTGASSRQIVKSVIGAGGTITVSSGQATIAAGTTATSVLELERDMDYLPLVKEGRFSISQRIANQDIYFGFYDEASAPAKWYFWFHFTSTVNTTVNCVCAWNPTTAPSGGEIVTQAVTLPASVTTAASNTYRIELLKDRVMFYINEVQVYTERRVVPHPHAIMASTLRVVNGTTPATNTNIVLDYDACNNFDVVSTENPSKSMEIVNPNVPAVEVMAYSQAGVITINTDLGFFDASQFRCFTIQTISMGTTGVVTVAHSQDNGTTWNTVQLKPIGGGASVTTHNAAGSWFFPGVGGIIRVRMTTATTAGTTTIRVKGLHHVPAMWLDNVTVSGTITANLGTGGTGATAIGKAEDAVAASGDTGVATWGVRRDALTTSASATGDYNEMAVNRFGAMQVGDFRTNARSFVAAFQVTAAASATDIADMFGNGTTTVHSTKVCVSGIATSASEADVLLVKRSAATSGGTRAAATAVPLDASDSAASSIPGGYSANPTPGTLVGAIGRTYIPLNTASSSGESDHCFIYGDKSKPIVLSGTGQGIALNLNGVTITGGVFNVEVHWYEF